MTRSLALYSRLICMVGAFVLAGQFVVPSVTSAAASSDVSVTKTGNGPVTAGQQAVFTITARNAGPDTATITLTDTLNGFTPTSVATSCPPGGTFVGGTTCQIAPWSGTCPGTGGVFTSTFAGGYCQITPTGGTCPTSSTGTTTYTPTTSGGYCRTAPVSTACPAPTGVNPANIVFNVTDGACEYNLTTVGQAACTPPYRVAQDNQTCIYAPSSATTPSEIVCPTGYTATSAPGPTNTQSPSGTVFMGTYCQAAPTALTCPTGYAQTTTNGTMVCQAAPTALTCSAGYSQAGSAGGFTCQAQLTNVCTVTNGVLTCTFSNVAMGGSATIQLVRNTSTADCGQTFTNTAAVTGSNYDPNTANNTATASIAVTCTTVTPPTTGVVQICGQVTSYTSAMTTSTGSVTINGMTFTIAANTATTALTNTFYCLTFTFTNGVVTGIVVAPNLANAQLVCGIFTPVSATATAQTTLYVGNMLFSLQPGLTIPSWLLAYQGQTLCFFLNSSGQINGVLTSIPTSIQPAHRQGYPSGLARPV